jgi:thiamine pyrophosphate-dependent acetolactate synthase large subunit-like protein
MLSSLRRRVETVRRTEDIGRAMIAAAEDIRTGRPQPGAVEITIDQQFRRASVELPEPRRDSAAGSDSGALAKTATALGGMVEYFSLLWFVHGTEYDEDVAMATLTRL